MNTPVVKYRGLLNLANQASEGNLQGLKAFAAVAEDAATQEAPAEEAAPAE